MSIPPFRFPPPRPGGFIILEPGQAIAPGFGSHSFEPDMIETTCLDSAERTWVQAGLISVNEARRQITTAVRGKCGSCGSSEYRNRSGQMVCAYCRSAT